MRTFILADNQYITRVGVQSIIQDNNWANQIVYANNLIELQTHLKTYPSAVVLIDYSLFDISSAEHLLILIEATYPSFWILFSEELSPSFLRQVLFHESTKKRLSIILKRDNQEEIITALQDAIQNKVYFSEHIHTSLKDKTTPSEKQIHLTKTEKIILSEIAQGKTTKEIAWERNISFHTVNSHRKNIFRKIEVNNVQEAIRYAVRAGLLDTSDYYI